MTENKLFTIDVETENYENAYFENDKFLCYEDDYDAILKRLNELAEENQSLKFDNKELIRFITSKGYTLQDYIKFIGQFQSVEVNKEDWE